MSASENQDQKKPEAYSVFVVVILDVLGQHICLLEFLRCFGRPFAFYTE